jgi:hypothetical protein
MSAAAFSLVVMAQVRTLIASADENSAMTQREIKSGRSPHHAK